MAHHLTLRLDRQDLAAMPCSAGVAGAVLGLVNIAHSGHATLSLDGCMPPCAVIAPSGSGRRLVTDGGHSPT